MMNTVTNQRLKDRARSEDEDEDVIGLAAQENPNPAQLKENSKVTKKRKTQSMVEQQHDVDNEVPNVEPSNIERDAIPLICFEEAKSSKAKCRGCEQKIDRGSMKLGIRTFYAARGTVFPVTGWYHLHCGISLTSNRNAGMICRGCRNNVLASPSAEEDSFSATKLGTEELVILGGKITKREAMCQTCIHDALMLPMNKGLHQKDVLRLDGYTSLSTAMQEKSRYLFRLQHRDTDGSESGDDR